MKIFLKQNVFDAALDRIRYLFDEFDEIIVSHSGGKDSEIVYQLSLIVAAEKNRLPLKVMFIDQEAEWTSTIERLREIEADSRVEMLWLQVPIKLFNAVSRDEEWLMCWEAGKEDEWVRAKEPNSIKENIYGTDRFKELFSAYVKTVYPSDVKVANLGGVRCEESPVRMLGLTHAATYKHITWGKSLNRAKTHFSFYPIYDWSFTDVWKAIHLNKWAYNRHYDLLYMYGEPVSSMRVSNVHHETAVKSLFHLQEIDPELYNALTIRLKGIDMAGKFKDDFFIHELPYMFKDWEEYRDFLLEKLAAPERKELFRKKFHKTGEIFRGNIHYDRLMREHIQCLMANDYHFTKLDNFIKRPGLIDVRKSKKKRALEAFNTKIDSELPPLENRLESVSITVACSNFANCLNPDERQKTFEDLSGSLTNREFAVSVDEVMINHYHGLKKAWQTAFDQNKPYCLLFEEDVQLCDKFFESLPEAMELFRIEGVAVLQFGAMSSKFANWRAQGYSAVQRNWLAWHWAVMMHRSTLGEVLELAEKMRDVKFFDDVITAYLQQNNLSSVIPLPNLVSQHLPNHPARKQNLKSLFGRERVSESLAETGEIYAFTGAIIKEKK